MASNGEWRRFVVVLALVVALGAVAGCSTEEDRAASRHAMLAVAGTGEVEAADPGFRVDVELQYRRAGTRWRALAEPVFAVRDESHVKAEVVLEPLRPRRTYTVHLVWIRPDGREMFRRHAEVTRHEITLPPGVLPDSTGAVPADLIRQWERRHGREVAEQAAALFADDPAAVVGVNDTVYKKAMDLQFAQHRRDVGGLPRVALESRLDISREREREPGRYLLRIYLDRRLLREVPFTITD